MDFPSFRASQRVRSWFIADDPSDHAAHDVIERRHGKVPYERLAHPLWWTICNLLFLDNAAVQQGEHARNIYMNRERYPALVRLTLDMTGDDRLGQAARSGSTVVQALTPYFSALERVAEHVGQIVRDGSS